MFVHTQATDPNKTGESEKNFPFAGTETFLRSETQTIITIDLEAPRAISYR